ncbi:hypothetical protein HHK36_030984 [Tetracentron sinense]|uniref:Uncharacterized protein n=1 Tax=Tetracentron sinense TaxID=13715 RepID=A0A835CYS6_TETSI|nr:hypothetical protein HHK36_030984 [Tetracentron sinense]
MDISTSLPSLPCEILSCDVTNLKGHTSEVFACAWSPEGSLLASGAGDATARIWTIADGPCCSSMQNERPNVLVLKHFKGRINEKTKDVTTLDWNGEGTLLATGSCDGQARIWSRDEASSSNETTLLSQSCSHWQEEEVVIISIGWSSEDLRSSGELLSFRKGALPALSSKNCQSCRRGLGVCRMHVKVELMAVGRESPVVVAWGVLWGHFCEGELVKNLASNEDKSENSAEALLSANADKICVDLLINPAPPGRLLPLITCVSNFFAAPTLDVDWRNNVSFATGSTDNEIYVCKIGESRPIRTFSGHQGEINAIKWNPTGSLLASCSDDSTAKVIDAISF